MKRNLTVLVLSAFALSLFAAFGIGCGGGQKDLAQVSQNNPNRPAWVDKGAGFFKGDHGKAFYGVGASMVKNPQLRRSAADAQARADLARTFQSNIKNMVKIYAAETAAGDPDRVSQENFTSEATKAFTNMDLSGSSIVDKWYDPIEKVQYSLAILDMESFQNQVQRMKELSAAVKEAIQKNATKAFDELDAEAEKQ